MAPARRPWILWLAGALALAALLVGCDSGEEGGGTTGPTAGGGAGSAAPERDVALWFTRGEQFDKVETELPAEGSVLVGAAKALVEGPDPELGKGAGAAQTRIPGDVQVEDVDVSSDGTAVVEVSPEFTRGIPQSEEERTRAQEAELNARVGQLTYTLTQFEQVEAAKVVAGGVAVEPKVERDDYEPPAKGPSRPERPPPEKGPGTLALQQRLAELRFLPDKAVDGVAGYRTQQAVIAFQAWNGLDRDGIVGPQTTAALARAKRPKASGRGPDRRIEVYRQKGVALLVTHDRTKRAIHVSAGAPGTPTPAGSYEVFRKEKRSWSVPFSVWLPWASYFNQGIAFHEYPDVPVYPASHGCVRVPSPEARGVYRFASLGTAVEVF